MKKKKDYNLYKWSPGMWQKMFLEMQNVLRIKDYTSF